MLLITKAQTKQLQAQYNLGSEMAGQKVIVKIFNPYGAWTWYVMNQDPNNPDYLWGIVQGFEVEMGSISLSELEEVKIKPFNLGLERDQYFEPCNALELWDKLLKD
ncbi:MAG: DUF2958 domain-containing protein [Candidatus Anammoxibacter sp.]